jgi:carbon-monoxide dehydrogenase small subunit
LKKLLINLIVNGVHHEILTKPHWTLAHVLREILNLTGTKIACGTGDCGCCTVIMNGKAILSCLTLAVKAEGADIQTIEGLALEGRLNPIQMAFTQDGAVQCGYCIPGMIMNMKAFLDENPESDAEDLRRVLGGNICRCTGYVKQVEALLKARDTIALEGKRSN